MSNELEVKAGLEISLGRTATALEKVAEWMGRTTSWPRYLSAQGQCSTDSNGNGLICLGPVPQGLRWQVRRMTVGGLYWDTSVSGSAVVFVTSYWASPDLDVPLILVKDQASGTSPALPSIATYGHGNFVVPGGLSIFLLIQGGGNGVIYTANADYVCEPLGS